jgi:hypothetical protein
MNAAELALERMAPGSNPKILLTSVSTQEFHLLEWK